MANNGKCGIVGFATPERRDGPPFVWLLKGTGQIHEGGGYGQSLIAACIPSRPRGIVLLLIRCWGAPVEMCSCTYPSCEFPVATGWQLYGYKKGLSVGFWSSLAFLITQ